MEWLLRLTPEQIVAFGSVIWKAIAAAGFFGTLIAFRKQVGGALDRLIRLSFRRGETQILAETPYRELPTTSPDLTQLPEKVESEAPPEQSPEPPRGPDTADAAEPFSAMLDGFFQRRLDDAERAYRRLQDGEPEPVKRLRNEAVYWAFRYRFAHDATALDRLRDLARNGEVRADALSWLAWSHQFARNFSAAQQALREAIEAAPDEVGRARYTAALARCISEGGAPGRALEVASQALPGLSQPESRAMVFEAIAEFEKSLGKSSMQALALEKALETKSEDSSALFAAAYAESESSLSLLALENYDTLLRFDPAHSTAANNLAVELDRLGMPIRAVAYFRRAADAGNTLAMANLAYRYMDKGFDAEAEKMLRIAATKEDPHANVAHATSALDERREGEKTRWNTLFNQSTRQREFLRAYTDAYYVSGSLAEYEGRWVKDGSIPVEFDQKNGTLLGTWEEAGVKRQLTAPLHNRSATVEVRRWEKGILLMRDDGGYWGAPASGYAYFLSEDEFLVMMLEKADVPTYLRFVRARDEEGAT